MNEMNERQEMINQYLENLKTENWKKENEKLYNNPIIVNLIKEIDRIQLSKHL